MKAIDAREIKGSVDYGIISIKPEEYRALIQRFRPEAYIKGLQRQYGMATVMGKHGNSYRVVMMKCAEAAEGEAQAAAQAMIRDLSPSWILVVGIAGAVPDDAFTLGDVVVGNRVVDFTLNALKPGGVVELGLTGGPMMPEVQGVVANLEVLALNFEEWNSKESIGVPRPEVSFEENSFVAHDREWNDKIRMALTRHFVDHARDRPWFIDGAIGSSDSLMRDTERLSLLLAAARQVKAVEMELAGVYRAAHDNNVPVLSIRGISDIIGFRRSEDWTRYACEVAASFTLAFLKAEPKNPVRTWKEEIKYESRWMLSDRPSVPLLSLIFGKMESLSKK